MRRAGLALAILALVTPGASSGTRALDPSIAVQPAWSPDGDALAYTTRQPGSSRTDISVVLVPAGPSWRLTAGDARTRHGHPSWSRDGERVAFRSADESSDAHFAVSIATRDGLAGRDVASGGGSGQTCYTAGSKILAFAGFEEVDAAFADGSAPQWTIYGGAGFPVCALRKARVAFAALAPGSSSLDVWTADPDGKRRRRLTYHRGADIPQAWSRDGKVILFSTERDGRIALDVMASDGKHQHRVAWASEGDLSPAGLAVTYVKPKGGLYVVGSNGRRARRIVAGSGLRSPRWSPSGRWIAFAVPVATADGVGYRIDLVRPTGLGRRTIAR